MTEPRIWGSTEHQGNATPLGKAGTDVSHQLEMNPTSTGRGKSASTHDSQPQCHRHLTHGLDLLGCLVSASSLKHTGQLESSSESGTKNTTLWVRSWQWCVAASGTCCVEGWHSPPGCGNMGTINMCNKNVIVRSWKVGLWLLYPQYIPI